MQDTAVVLRNRHEIYNYAEVHTSNDDHSFNAQANATHQSSNNMVQGRVSKLTIMLVKDRIIAAERIQVI